MVYNYFMGCPQCKQEVKAPEKPKDPLFRRYQVVECIDANGSRGFLRVGQWYSVEFCDDKEVKVAGSSIGWKPSRFKIPAPLILGNP
jgi:hypothetical protein